MRAALRNGSVQPDRWTGITPRARCVKMLANFSFESRHGPDRVGSGRCRSDRAGPRRARKPDLLRPGACSGLPRPCVGRPRRLGSGQRLEPSTGCKAGCRMRWHTARAGMFIFLGLGVGTLAAQEPGPPLPGTKPLTMRGDIASELVAGVDRFLLRQIDESTANRPRFWKRDLASGKAYEASVQPNRKRLAHILGARDQRVSVPAIRRIVDPSGGVNKIFGRGQKGEKDVHFVSWPAFGDVTGEGLELGTGAACVIVVPDADQTPEQVAGLVPGLPSASQVGRRLAESHCRVFIPTLIDRTVASRNGRARLTNREFIYRSAFELGRHVIGYEVQKVLALVERAGAGMPDPRAGAAPGDLRPWGGRGDCRCMPRRSTRGSRPPASADTSATAMTCGASRWIGTSSACWSSSATPRWPRSSRRGP